MNRRLFPFTLVLILSAALSAADADISHTDAKGAAALIDQKKLVVLDVRTPDEFAEGHIAGAQNLDFNASDFKTKLSSLDKSKPYLVHCASGGRSTRSLKLFQELGFAHITHLDGGFNAWRAAGQKVAR